MCQKFVNGDVVKLVDGSKFSNGANTCIVHRTEKDFDFKDDMVWLLETGTWIGSGFIELANEPKKIVKIEQVKKEWKVGDTVTPLRKSVGDKLEECKNWKEAVEMNENFLIVKIIYSGGDLGLVSSKNERGASWYKKDDVIPYVAPESETAKEEMKIPLILTAKQVIDMVNMGILKETSEISIVKFK